MSAAPDRIRQLEAFHAAREAALQRMESAQPKRAAEESSPFGALLRQILLGRRETVSSQPVEDVPAPTVRGGRIDRIA